MREVLIKTFYRVSGEYEVRLGNGTVYRFKSEKATKKFLADTNRFLSDVTFQLNNCLSEIYAHSREVWIVSTDHKLFHDEISMLEHFVKQAYDRAGFANGNYFVFIDLKKFCDSSKSIIKSLLSVKYVRQTDTVRKYKLNCLFDQVQSIHLRLLNYGQSQCFQTFSTDRIEDLSSAIDDKTKLRIAS